MLQGILLYGEIGNGQGTIFPVMCTVPGKGTFNAPGALPADLSGVPDDQGMVFPKKGCIRPQSGLQEAPQRLIRLIPLNHPQPAEQSPGIGIDDEDRAAEGVQQDVVGGLRADPVDRQEGLP